MCQIYLEIIIFLFRGPILSKVKNWKSFKLGQKLKVKIAAISPLDRKINLVLANGKMNPSPNHRIGFHTIEMLLRLSPENIKQIFIPANRNDARIQNLISLAEVASVSVERKKNLNQHPEATLKKEEV